MPGVERLLEVLLATSSAPHIIHGDLQFKNILVGAHGNWQAIDPFTCRGDINAETALRAVVQRDESSVE
jgi:streptomycin 6-kinase